MILTRLTVRNLRNLAEIDIYPAPKLNFFIGKNASGKTSLLEAIYLLGTARTFRTQKGSRLIAHGKSDLTVFGQIYSTIDHRIGIKKSSDQINRIQLDGRVIKRSAELASLFPIQLITPDSFLLLTDGPNQRRAFIDWSLFHVEHQFHELWQRFGKLLKQRNTLLKSGNYEMLRHWDSGLMESAAAIDGLRKSFITQFTLIVQKYLQILLPAISLDFKYHQGWRNDMSLQQALEKAEPGDLKRGFTSVGPHRADLEVRQDRIPAIDILSRGQQKLLVSAMKLAQIDYLQQQTEKICTVLVDDLPAELDKINRDTLLQILYSMDTQLFVTATDPQMIESTQQYESKMFHVKHGEVEEMVY
jgi:DNA replication and repair protein RecF